MFDLAPPLQCPPGVTFDEKAHVYTVDGRVMTSVSARLKVLDPDAFAFVSDKVLAAAADLGTRTHHAIAMHLRDWLDLATLDDDVIPHFLQWEQFLEDVEGFEVTHSEAVVVSRRHGFAGSLDIAGIYQDRRCLIDTKRVASVPRTAGPQTAGYEIGFRETFQIPDSDPIDRYALHLPKTGRPQLQPLTSTTDRAAFLSANNVLKWRALK